MIQMILRWVSAGLPFINIMNKDGTLNENAGPFQGQDRFVARKNVVQQLEAMEFW